MRNGIQRSPIAVVGIGAMFPGRGTTVGYWRDIVEGADTTSEIPTSHWLAEDFFDSNPAAPDKTYSKRGAFIPSFPFDPIAFGLPPRVIETTDTVQLVALYVARQVLEEVQRVDAQKVDPERTSVVLGVAAGTELIGDMASRLNRPIWIKAMREHGMPQDEAEAVADRISGHFPEWRESTFPGLLGNVVAGRIANRLDLGGANFTADAACASSLAAVRHAMQELWLGDSDMVLAGGADALNNIFMYMCFSKTPAMSAAGHCRPFSDDADGTLMGEGCGIFALRRLEDAERDGNTIYAVIRGIGASSDGRATSVYAPRADGQARAITRAYEAAGYSPRSVELMEAHGTGTRAGDAAEFAGLNQVFGAAGKGSRNWCALGSVKSQIGHTKSAAGAASLIKAVLSLHHKVLPPSINVRRPNPKLGIEESPFYLNVRARPWIRDRAHPRRASISSFGFGGSNFHAALEEYCGPAARPARYRTMPWELFVLSAASPAMLSKKLDELASACRHDDDLAHHAHESQRAFSATESARFACVASSRADLLKKLSTARPQIAAGRSFTVPDIAFSMEAPAATQGRIGFLFAGQGSQYVGMGASLAIHFETARLPWDAAADDASLGEPKLHDIAFPPHAFDGAGVAGQTELLTRTENAQPAIGLVALSQLALTRALGLQPDAVTGHSFGEIMALHAAGALEAEAAIRLARARGRAMARAAASDVPGAMLAVFAGRETIEPYLRRKGNEVVLANNNAPDQVVLSGSATAIEVLEAELKAAGHGVGRLNVATAFHSPLVAGATAALEVAIEQAQLAAPRLPVYANTTAQPYPDDVRSARNLLARQLAAPVHFLETVEAMYRDGVRTFVEIGPSDVLRNLVGSILRDKPHLAVALDERRKDGVHSLNFALAQLCVAGVRLNFDALWTEAPAPPLRPVAKAHEIALNGANYGKLYPPKQPAAHRASDHTPAQIGTTAAPPLEPQGPNASGPLVAHARAGAPAQPQHCETIVFPRGKTSGAAHDMGADVAVEIRKLSAGLARECERFIEAMKQSVPRPETTNVPSHTNGVVELATVLPISTTSNVEAFPLAIVDAVPPPSVSAPPELAETVRAIVADKTGYPADMLEMDMDLESELGIDSIKQVEILSELRERLPSMPKIEPAQLSKLRTLNQIANAIASDAPALEATLAAPVADPTLAAPAEMSALAETVRTIVADKTGYPADMLEMNMDLESELGIDSIKQVEILSALRERLPSMPKIEPAQLSKLRTLNQIANAIAAEAPVPGSTLAAAVAEPTLAAPAEMSALTETVRAIVADKTGYPADMLEMDMDLESELGIDSIKQVEILSALRERLPAMPRIEPAQLSKLRTLHQIVNAVAGDAPTLEPTLAAPVADPSLPTPAIVPAAVTVGRAPTAEAAVADMSTLTETVRAIVADKTGYPADMLDMDMDLESELGIDSIKQVEILSALRERLPAMPRIEPAQLSKLRTLNQIADAIAAPPDTANAPAVAAVSVADFAEHAAANGLYRQAVELEVLPPLTKRLRLSGEALIEVTTDAQTIAEALAASLGRHGLRTRLVDVPSKSALFVICTSGLAATLTPIEMHRRALVAARAVAATMSSRGGWFVVLQSTDGRFGHNLHDIEAALRGGLTGLAKTAAEEWPRASVRAIDIEIAGDTPAAVADRLAQEIVFGDVEIEVGLANDGKRRAPVTTPIAYDGVGYRFKDGDRIVVSGGARGITAAIVKQLAGVAKLRFLLLGRSARVVWPEGVPQHADVRALRGALAAKTRSVRAGTSLSRIAAEADALDASREIERTLAAIRAAGSEAVYEAVDISNDVAVNAAIDRFRQAHGSICGLIHGAGVIADRLIADKTDAQFERVMRTKVDGLRALLSAVGQDELGFVALFASIAARFGNAGQSDYAMANEVLNRVAWALQNSRPNTRVISFNWGPWLGGMVNEAVRAQFESRGVRLIPVEIGVEAFLQELVHGGPPEIVFGGPLASDHSTAVPAVVLRA